MDLSPALELELRRLLPAQLQDRLHETDGMRDALKHLNSLERAVSSFLPAYIVDDATLIGESADSYGDRSLLRTGVFLFADVSGFTALSERLQQAGGAEGTEVLTDIINKYFSAMLEILAKSEGQLLKFAGDALLAFFPSARSEVETQLVRKAVRTGLRMQRSMRQSFQPIQDEALERCLGADHGAQLTMSIGIAGGRLYEALVGNSNQRDHIIQGSLPGQAMDAEAAGERDEVIVSGDLTPDLADVFHLKELGDGYFQVLDDVELDDFESELLMVRRRQGVSAGLFDLEQGSLTDSLSKAVDKVRRVGRFVPPTVLSGLIHSEDQHVRRENRTTATMFVHATGFAETIDLWGAGELPLITGYLARYYSAVQRIVSQYGGTLTRTDPYKLGFKLLCTFGAPIQHSDDPLRAVSAAIELNFALIQLNQRIRDELPPALAGLFVLQHRIGITLGETLSGEAGWKQRREYTVMGDDVNLAARLMAHASFGEVLVSERIHEHVQGHVTVQALEPIALKGKKLPVRAFRVMDDIESAGMLTPASEIPFIGHELFMLKLELLLQQARFGRAKSLALVGDAGIGKTRIARQFAEMAHAAGFRVAWATCQPRSRIPVWASLIAQLLELDLSSSQDEQRQQFEARVSAGPYADLRRPLSGLLFGAAVDARAVSAEIDAAPARPKLNDIFAMVQQMSPDEMKRSGMLGLMRRRLETTEAPAAPAPEAAGLYQTAQRLTSIEQGVVQFLQRCIQKQPTLIVIDDLHLAPAESQALLRTVLGGVQRGQFVLLTSFEPLSVEIDIKTEPVPDLGLDETERAAIAILHATELDPELSALLWKRTSGRPIFIESLLRELMDSQYIVVESGRAALSADARPDTLPDNVRQLVISRIDRLSPEAQDVIRVAAVLGETFTRDALERTMNDGGDLSEAVRELIEAHLIEGPEADLYSFRHGMTQSVVYGTLSRAQRSRLHQAAQLYYEAQPPSDDRPIQIAHHMAGRGLLPGAIELLTSTADVAEADNRPLVALRYITFARTLLPNDHDLMARQDALVARMQSNG